MHNIPFENKDILEIFHTYACGPFQTIIDDLGWVRNTRNIYKFAEEYGIVIHNCPAYINELVGIDFMEPQNGLIEQ